MFVYVGAEAVKNDMIKENYKEKAKDNNMRSISPFPFCLKVKQIFGKVSAITASKSYTQTHKQTPKNLNKMEN